MAWIKDFLNNRWQRVALNGVTSQVLNGVPQGSVLGPIIFVKYMNDIIENLKSETYQFQMI